MWSRSQRFRGITHRKIKKQRRVSNAEEERYIRFSKDEKRR